MPASYSSSSYYYSSATSTTNGTETSGHRYTTSSHTDQAGNTVVRTAHQDLGAPAVVEERHYDRTGQELLPSSSSEKQQWGKRRIEDMSDEEYNFGVTPSGASSVDSSSQDFSRESNLPTDGAGGGTRSPPEDPSGSAIGRYRGSLDEGAVDPMTGGRYSQRDAD